MRRAAGRGPAAGEATGDEQLARAAKELAAQITAGAALDQQCAAARQLPPLVRAALMGGSLEDGMIVGLAKAAEMYRERATSWVGRMAIVTPIVATLVLGGLIVVVYAVLML